MSQLAIGMIETVGLVAGIEAADVCLKSANVTLIGYELTKGNGMTVVKIEGNVGAVKAAIEAATVAVNKISKVFSTKVIPRPSEGIDLLMKNCDTIGYESEKEVDELIKNSDEDKCKSDIQIETKEYYELEEINNIKVNNQELSLIYDNEDKFNQEINNELGYTCNLCKDSNCPRQKGDLKTKCIHYEDQNKLI